jgi:lipid A 3-O-deacylase
MRLNLFLTLPIFCWALSVPAWAAAPNDSLPSRDLQVQTAPFKGYARVKIENDMLVARHKTDRYYTSGVRADYLFLKNPSSKLWFANLFPRLKNADNYVGITLASNMYTPASKIEQIAVGDRPYAGWLYAGMHHVSNNVATSTRFRSEYTLGVIGKAAMQQQMQAQVHNIINRPMPMGWEHQIASDIAVNVNFSAEKRLMQPAEYLDLVLFVEANVGTVMNYGGGGGMMRLGWFNDYFDDPMPVSKRQKWQAFVFIRPQVRIVADNALLQGGMFTYKDCAYTIERDNVNRYYMETEFGYSVSYRNLNFTYSQSIRTPEFRSAKNMFWGGVSAAIAF